MNNAVRIHEMLEYVRAGRIMDAMNEFYDSAVVMEEPMYGKTIGLQANLEREEKFVASVREFMGFLTPKVAIGDDCSLYENVMDWVGVDGEAYHVEQVAAQQWRDGKITYERFYYSMG